MAKHRMPFQADVVKQNTDALEPNVEIEKPHDVKAVAEVVANKVTDIAKKDAKESGKPKIARIIVDLANIRKKPSLDAEIVSTVTKGAEFKVTSPESKNGFTSINVGGVTAFIKSDLVSIFDNPAYVAHDVNAKLGV